MEDDTMIATACAERRRATRRSVDVTARFRPRFGGAWKQATVEDVGGRGVRMRTAAPLQPRQVVVLHADGEFDGDYVEIVWVRKEGLIPLGGGRYASGYNIGGRVVGSAPKLKMPSFETGMKLFRGGLVAGGLLLAGFVGWSLLQVVLAMR